MTETHSVPAGAALTLALLLTACSTGSTPSSRPGVVEGAVTYKGLPCAPVIEHRTPPCSGPIAGVRLDVLDRSGRTAGKTTTDVEGRFRIELAPGSYSIRPEEPWTEQTRSLELAADQSARLDFELDTGVR